MEQIAITTEYITLVDGEFESRRGRKLYKGMTIKVLNKEYKIV